jgi:heme-degrading monooxygenase HmoA
MFIAMNRFKVGQGKDAAFEEAWRTRQSYLSGVPGFLHFALLKGDAPGDYISHSTWADRAAFEAWMKSEAFVAGHRQGSLMGVLEGPPVPSLYDVVLEESGTSR